jgi:murein DD-endopeptidase MepM/ murein hydrolase activator NlpD
MSLDPTRITEPAVQRSEAPDRAGAAHQRDQLLRIAQEFESMLLVQVLRDMRRAGSWEGEEERGKGYGAEIMGDTIDVELAAHLVRAKGLGLSNQLLESFERRHGVSTTAVDPAAPVPAATVAAYVETPAAALGGNAPRVTSEFGWRTDPFTGRETFHKGVDLAAVYGQDVQAAMAGRVTFSGNQGGYGTSVVVEHQDGSRSRYAHLSEALVAPGTMVAAGQLLGRAGRSGRATGTHLHFEVTAADGRPLSPSEWAHGIGSRGAAR